MRARSADTIAVICMAVGLVAIRSQEASAQGGQATAASDNVVVQPTDPGRPWGWAVRAYMENPDQQLYNRAKAKLLAGQQVFSHTIS
jgi:hypothetical protein